MHRIARRLLVVCLAAAALVVVAATAGAAVSVQPHTGGQGTIFQLDFEANGQDAGPDDWGDELHLRGPAGTPCAGELLGTDIIGFGAGPGRFLLGPRAPRPRFEDSHLASYRVASPWCPGRYSGWIEEYLGEFGTEDLGRFAFTVRRSRRSPGALLDRERRLVEELPPDNRGVRIRPRHIRRDSTVTVDFETGLTRDEHLELRLVSPEGRGCPDLEDRGGVFRPGRGRLRIGPHARELGSNDRAFRVPLCAGRWIGFLGQLAFTFVVHRR